MQTEFARRLGVSRLSVSELLHEKRALSPDMAMRLGKLLGTSAESWLFGSRTDDTRRGGGINLLIRPGRSAAGQPFRRRVRFLARLEHVLRERKIDVVVESPMDDRPIVRVAHSTGVRL